MTQPHPPSSQICRSVTGPGNFCISHKLPGNVDAPGLSSIFENPQALDNKEGFGASKIWLLKTMIHEILKKVDRSGHFRNDSTVMGICSGLAQLVPRTLINEQINIKLWRKPQCP